MDRTSMVVSRTAGSIVGLLVGGFLMAGPLVVLQRGFFGGSGAGSEETVGRFTAVNPMPLIAVGGVVGAAAAATLVQKALKQTSSFWKAKSTEPMVR